MTVVFGVPSYLLPVICAGVVFTCAAALWHTRLQSRAVVKGVR